MSNYQPKLNIDAMRMGYVGADPRVVGLTGGYQTRVTPTPTPTPQSQQVVRQDEPTQRPNPYIK